MLHCRQSRSLTVAQYFAALILGLLVASPLAHSQDADGSSESATTSEMPAQASDGAPPTMESLGVKPRPAQPDWLLRIDEAFGAWIVGPMASVLFYTAGTENWLKFGDQETGTAFRSS